MPIDLKDFFKQDYLQSNQVYRPTADGSNSTAIEKNIHIIWVGVPIFEKHLKTLSVICALAKKNHFIVNVWTEKSSQYYLTAAKADCLHLPVTVRDLADLTEGIQRDYTPHGARLFNVFNAVNSSPNPNYAARSDLLRLEIKRQFGGVYLDCDVSVLGCCNSPGFEPKESQTFSKKERSLIRQLQLCLFKPTINLSPEKYSLEPLKAPYGFLTKSLPNSTLEYKAIMGDANPNITSKYLTNSFLASCAHNIILIRWIADTLNNFVENRTQLNPHHGINAQRFFRVSNTKMHHYSLCNADLKRFTYGTFYEARLKLTLAESGPNVYVKILNEMEKKQGFIMKNFYFPSCDAFKVTGLKAFNPYRDEIVHQTSQFLMVDDALFLNDFSWLEDRPKPGGFTI